MSGGERWMTGRAARLWLLAVVMSLAWDRAAYRLAVVDEAGRRELEGHDWYRLLRVCGYLLTWAVVAAALVLADRARLAAGAEPSAGDLRPAAPRAVNALGLRRGVLLMTSVTGAGVIAELLKAIVARERPSVTGGYYNFRGFFTGFAEAQNLGMPSSHAAVAFAGALALGRMHRATWPLMLGLAVGCGATRVATGAHFLSDVCVGALVSYAWCRWVFVMDERLNGG
ncbi:MAG TPA: phosphatase PAP2 family protein [Phycisphaerales bacterium]|nr:phosphatase PAP2 family protein [Phycisphaerales bacterium]